MEREIKTLREQLKPLAEEAALNGGIEASCYCFRNYSEKDWQTYEVETGNPRCDSFDLPKNPIEAAIDKATGLDEERESAILKFGIWFLTDYNKAFDGLLEEEFNPQE